MIGLSRSTSLGMCVLRFFVFPARQVVCIWSRYQPCSERVRGGGLCSLVLIVSYAVRGCLKGNAETRADVIDDKSVSLNFREREFDMDRVLPSINSEFPSHAATPSAPVSQFCLLVWTFFALAALDIAVNAAAGPAAVATACHVNGSALTARALQLGALAGVTKSGVLAFVEFLGYAGLPTPAWMLLLLFASSFGICVLVTAEISNLVLGESMFNHLWSKSVLIMAF